MPISLEQFREAYVFAERELAKVRHILPSDNFLQLLRQGGPHVGEYLALTLGALLNQGR